MKLTTPCLLLVLVLLVCSTTRGQNSSDHDIARLKDEIARREAIDRDDNTPNDLKATNRRILDQRRSQLVAAIQARIAAVQKYLETLGPAATEEERQNARDSLRNASSAADGLSNSSDGVERPQTKKSAPSSDPRTINQSEVAASFLKTKATNGETDSPADDVGFKLDAPAKSETVVVQPYQVKVSLTSDPKLKFPLDFNVAVKDKDGKIVNTILTIKVGETSGVVGITLKEGKNSVEVSRGDVKLPAVEITYTPVPNAAAAEAKIKVDKPDTCATADCPKPNAPTVDAYLTVADVGIKKIGYEIFKDGKTVFTGDQTEVNNKKATVRVQIVRGENIIRFFDADDPGNSEKQAFTKVVCNGGNCADDFLVATIPSNSRFTRAIVGIEQAGGSSAESKSNPFLDFFFTTPLRFNTKREEEAVLNPDGSQAIGKDGKPLTKWKTVGEPVPRFGSWAQLRFSTTPEQTSAFAVFPSSFVNQVTDPTKVVDLVQSFDFLAGVEARAFNANGWIWTLIPGIRQRTSLYFTFGGGAISPLSVKKESAQIFTIPTTDSQLADFKLRFGDPKGATYVGFVPLERDRFFRQYYFGVRLKTHYCEDEDCHTYKNRFPSIVDIGIGQNEAVTGGRFKSDIKDAANNLVGHRRAWVARLDAFFPLPFREANFLYLYGTAMMKILGSGVQIKTPFFLESPGTTIKITDSTVYIPPPEFQPTRIDRDYYKIGIGVNLTDLFNRNKPKGP